MGFESLRPSQSHLAAPAAPSFTATPPTGYTPMTLPGKVVRVNKAGSLRPGNLYPKPDAAKEMVHRAVMELSGRSTMADAGRAFVHHNNDIGILTDDALVVLQLNKRTTIYRRAGRASDELVALPEAQWTPELRELEKDAAESSARWTPALRDKVSALMESIEPTAPNRTNGSYSTIVTPMLLAVPSMIRMAASTSLVFRSGSLV